MSLGWSTRSCHRTHSASRSRCGSIDGLVLIYADNVLCTLLPNPRILHLQWLSSLNTTFISGVHLTVRFLRSNASQRCKRHSTDNAPYSHVISPTTRGQCQLEQPGYSRHCRYCAYHCLHHGQLRVSFRAIVVIIRRTLPQLFAHELLM